MHHQLLLMRHAKSSWDSDAPGDFERPLATRGRKAAPRIARWLAREALIPDQIISSTAERARQTTLAVAGELALDAAVLRWEKKVYSGSLTTLRDMLRACPEKHHRIMLVGHNPDLEDLFEWLCGEATPSPPDGKLLPTAAVAVLGIDSRWRDLKRDSATLIALMRPRELKKR